MADGKAGDDMKATSANGMTFRARWATRRACWTIDVVAWALRRLCAPSHRKSITEWALEFAKAELFYLDNPGRRAYPDRGCELPPPNWYCTRSAGHPGPCAALPLRLRP